MAQRARMANFSVVALVSLHLALNWDWILATLRPRRTERVAIPEPSYRLHGIASAPWQRRLAKVLGRGLTPFLAVSIAAGLAYFAMAITSGTPTDRGQSEAAAASNPPTPQARPVSLPHGFEQLSVTGGFVVLAVFAGRYLFRLRL